MFIRITSLFNQKHKHNCLSLPCLKKLAFLKDKQLKKKKEKHTCPLQNISRWWFQIFIFLHLPGEMIQFE